MLSFKDYHNKSLNEESKPSFEPGFNTFRHGKTSIDYSINPRQPKQAEIHMVLTDKDEAGKGSARKAMDEFLKHSDHHGVRTHLTPEPLTSDVKKAKLTNFYQSLGYKPNKGKNRDFTVRSTHIREPQ